MLIVNIEMMIFVTICLLCLPLSIPSLAIAYRSVHLSLVFLLLIFYVHDVLCSRLCKNKFFGSAFNINTAAMMILTGVTVPVSAATNLSLLASLEEEELLACILKPSILWVWTGSIFICAFFSVLFLLAKGTHWHWTCFFC